MQIVNQTVALWDVALTKAEQADSLSEETQAAMSAAAGVLRQQRDQLQGLGSQMDDIMHVGNAMALRMQNTLTDGAMAATEPDMGDGPAMVAEPPDDDEDGDEPEMPEEEPVTHQTRAERRRAAKK